MNRMKRGKPHKQETQIMVEEPNPRKMNHGRIEKSIDKCLPPTLVGTERGLLD